MTWIRSSDPQTITHAKWHQVHSQGEVASGRTWIRTLCGKLWFSGWGEREDEPEHTWRCKHCTRCKEQKP